MLKNNRILYIIFIFRDLQGINLLFSNNKNSYFQLHFSENFVSRKKFHKILLIILRIEKVCLTILVFALIYINKILLKIIYLFLNRNSII